MCAARICTALPRRLQLLFQSLDLVLVVRPKRLDFFLVQGTARVQLVRQVLELFARLVQLFVHLLEVSIFGRVLGLVLTQFFLRQLEFLFDQRVQLVELSVLLEFILFARPTRNFQITALARLLLQLLIEIVQLGLVLGLELGEGFCMLLVGQFQALLADLLVFIRLIAFALHLGEPRLLVQLLLLKLFLVFDRAFLEVLDALLELALINVLLLAARDCQISRGLADYLGADLCEALRAAGILGAVSLEPLFDYIDLLLHHVHRLEEVLVQLLAHFLHFRVEELFSFALAVLEELRLELLTAAGDALAQHALVIGDILPERFRLEHGDGGLADGLVGTLQHGLVE